MIPLAGQHIRLEPLTSSHVPSLAAAAASAGELYRWSLVPTDAAEAAAYVATALQWQEQGTAVPFAIVDATSGEVIGSTRYFLLERWLWPAGHARHGNPHADACEIGYTWLAPGAIRTGANREAKLLMLSHAFETWKMLRVCFHTDVRNQRSRDALAGIGAQSEGILRAHRLATDAIARDSARFSILAAEWPVAKARLLQHLRP